MVNRILNAVGWIGMALVVAAVGIRFGLPLKEQYAYYLAWAGLVCVLVYTLGQWREIAGAFSGRQARYGTLAGVSILVVLGILVAINYIASQKNPLPEKYIRRDLTTSKRFTLSDQSRNVVSKLDSPLRIRVFTTPLEFQRFREKLTQYEYASKNVSTEYIDPDRKPMVARQDQVEQYGTIVFEYNGRKERVTSDVEQELTNAIIKVVSGKQRKIYFTQGHGERDSASSERDGYATIKAALGRENYGVDNVVLAQKGAVPDDASVVVVAGPKIDFFPKEIDALKTYLGKSGKLLMALDPQDQPESQPLTGLIALAHDWGVDVNNDIVFDLSARDRLSGASEVLSLAARYPSHPITERFRVITGFQVARSVTPVMGGVGGHTAQPVVETSEDSWAKDVKVVLASKEGISIDRAKDKQGPFALAAAVSAPSTEPAAPGDSAAPKPETRVVVFGDSDFASNTYLPLGGNRDLFLNSIGWLSQQGNLISIRPKEPDDRRLTLTVAQQQTLLWLSLVIIPGFVFGSGVYTWWRRR